MALKSASIATTTSDRLLDFISRVETRSRESELGRLSCYNLVMNKRAKKRLIETLKKEISDKSKPTKDQAFSSPKQQQERRGFIAKPAKKRG